MPRLKSKTQDAEKQSSKTITFRLPETLISDLHSEARLKNISLNVLVKQILEKYANWDRFASQIGMLQVPQNILKGLGKDLHDDDIQKIVDEILPIIQNSVMFMKNGFDLERTIETLEDYMKNSGMSSDHRIENGVHHFVIQHNLGMTWSQFVELLFREIFQTFNEESKLEFQVTDSTVLVSADLGLDFDEHSY